MAERQHLARDGLRVRVQRLKTTSGDVWAEYLISGQRNDKVYQLPVRHFVPTDKKWTPPSCAAPSVGPFLRKPTDQELTPLAEAATCSTADQVVLDFMCAGLDATHDAAVVAEIRRMHVGHARKWHEFQRQPAAFARYWPAHLVGTLRKGYLVYEDFGATVIPSPVQRDRAATQASTADWSRGLFANYHPPCSEKEGYTRRDNAGSTCHTNRVHQRAVETTTGDSAPLESLFDGFGDYAPFAHALTIEVNGEWVDFDPDVHAYGALAPARRQMHDKATVAMYQGMFEDEILLRGRVGMLTIVMGRNADVLLWPLLQKAAAQASAATRKPYELRRPEVTPLPPPKKKPRDWQPERFRLKHSSRTFDMTMECRLQWDQATAFAQQGRLPPGEVTYFRGLAKQSKWGPMYESEIRQLQRDSMAVTGGWEGPSPLQGNWEELSMRKGYEAAVSSNQSVRSNGGKALVAEVEAESDEEGPAHKKQRLKKSAGGTASLEKKGGVKREDSAETKKEKKRSAAFGGQGVGPEVQAARGTASLEKQGGVTPEDSAETKKEKEPTAASPAACTQTSGQRPSTRSATRRRAAPRCTTRPNCLCPRTASRTPRTTTTCSSDARCRPSARPCSRLTPTSCR
jgi:hypothetical protein